MKFTTRLTFCRSLSLQLMRNIYSHCKFLTQRENSCWRDLQNLKSAGKIKKKDRTCGVPGMVQVSPVINIHVAELSGTHQSVTATLLHKKKEKGGGGAWRKDGEEDYSGRREMCRCHFFKGCEWVTTPSALQSQPFRISELQLTHADVQPRVHRSSDTRYEGINEQNVWKKIKTPPLRSADTPQVKNDAFRISTKCFSSRIKILYLFKYCSKATKNTCGSGSPSLTELLIEIWIFK